MEKETNNKNSRRDFLKMIPIALGSAIAIAGLDFGKSKGGQPRHNFNRLSKSELDEKIKNLHSNNVEKVKPKPPPIA